MTGLPEPTPAATAAGQAANPLTDAVIQAAVENAIDQARRHETTPQVVIGTAPPVAQPGRPPMSARATDASAMMIAGGFLSLCLGAAVSAVLYFSGTANETVVIAICAAPPATFIAAKGLLKGMRQAAPDEIHNHYSGHVYQDQRTTHSSTRGVWAKTNHHQ